VNLPGVPLAVAFVIFFIAIGFEEPASGIRKRPPCSYPPSLLAKKILCLAYVPAPFDKKELLKFLGLHAMSMIKVLKRYYRTKLWILLSPEHARSGCRVDLLLLNVLTLTVRMVEVKSARVLRDVFKIQAALEFPCSGADEVAVSNGETEELLRQSFIEETLAKKKKVEETLAKDPEGAARTYTPHPDACYTCANMRCPFLKDRSAGSSEIFHLGKHL
jgi:hypothetical protein